MMGLGKGGCFYIIMAIFGIYVKFLEGIYYIPLTIYIPIRYDSPTFLEVEDGSFLSYVSWDGGDCI